MYLDVGNYAAARLQILEALAKARGDIEIRSKAKKLWLKADKLADREATDRTRKARRLLDMAGMRLTIKDHAGAQEDALQAIEADPSDSRIRAAALERWREARKLAGLAAQAEANKKDRKHRALLEEAARQSAAGARDKATEIALRVLEETNDAALVELAQARLIANAPPSLFWQRVGVGGKWALDLILALALLLILYGVAWLVRWVVTPCMQRWLVDLVDDSSGLGVAELVPESLVRWSHADDGVSSGLLHLETLKLPTVPLTLSGSSLEFVAALPSLSLPLAGTSLSGVSTSLPSVRKWFYAGRRRVRGRVVVTDDVVTVRLTAIWTGGTQVSVESTGSKDRAAALAESVAYKMYYLLAKASSEPKAQASKAEAEAADKLRDGLLLLRGYLADGCVAQLDKAREIFRRARTEFPNLSEAYFYEGIALDIAEQHDEAITRFQYLQTVQNASNEALGEKASYNEAIARFRKYTPDELERAIKILERLVAAADNPALAKSPIRSLALAAKANAIAHRLIFWQRLALNESPTDDPRLVSTQKAQALPKVNAWLASVDDIVATLTSVSTTIREEPLWDDLARQQLSWAIKNATGNKHLNFARSFLSVPVLDPANMPKVEQHLAAANQAFRECEMLLSGVETLSNLGTVASQLGRQEEARGYFQRVVELNPDYEYGYYRMAQSWEREGRKDKVLDILRSFAKRRTPRIPGFIQLYERNSIELAKT